MTHYENAQQNTSIAPGIVGRLQKCGCRITAPRQTILGILASTAKHLSAEELYMLIHKTDPNIGIATVYRTLELLVRSGVLMKFDFGQHKSRYELAPQPGGEGHHNHIVCTSCGKVVNFTEGHDQEEAAMRTTRDSLARKYRFDIRDHQVQFFGLCNKCRSKRSENATASCQ